jgi:1-deoxy-D-xylulose-5-phosphate reductoisomerase
VLAAIEAGKPIALANKEILVMAGGLVMDAARRRGVVILPVDSEHNAIHQCLHGRQRGELRRLILTASGGPFRGRSAASLEDVTAADALQHPTWQMGPKITIDSATLMNKGLEVIEAHWLFGAAGSQIDVVVHPQSIVHSLVELTDGSMIAQIGTTDMRLPIQYAFSYPDRWTAPVPFLDLTRCQPLEFIEPAWDDFPCLRLAYRALDAERSLPIVLNAANEVAVASFLEGRLGFTAIAEVIRSAMDAHVPAAIDTLEAIRSVDRWARNYATHLVSTSVRRGGLVPPSTSGPSGRPPDPVKAAAQ